MRSWSYVRTPLRLYLGVLGPICGLMGFLLITETPVLMRASAGVVLLLTAVGLARGYVRRVEIGVDGAKLKSLTGTIEISWPRVRRMGAYVPGGGLGAVEYAYITTRDEAPQGKWDIDESTIQLQNRPGLLEAFEAARAAAQSVSSSAEKSPRQACRGL